MLPIVGLTAGQSGLNFFCGHSWEAKGCFFNNKKDVKFSFSGPSASI